MSLCFALQTVFRISTPKPFGLTLHNDKIYWTDWLKHEILVADKDDGSREEILQNNIESVMDIAVFHRKRRNSKSAGIKMMLQIGIESGLLFFHFSLT